MIILDNSLLVGALTGSKRSSDALSRVAATDEDFGVPALVYYEWLRGPRLPSEIDALNRLVRAESILPFGAVEAKVAAELYLSVTRNHPRGFDIAIAACAIVHNGPLWTLNPRDFEDIPGLRLYRLP